MMPPSIPIPSSSDLVNVTSHSLIKSDNFGYKEITLNHSDPFVIAALIRGCRIYPLPGSSPFAMDDGDLYDEFGNYIGPEIDESDSELDSASSGPDEGATADDDENVAHETQSGPADSATNGTTAMELFEGDGKIGEESRAVILPDDQEHYPAAQEVFGKDTEVLVEEEDAQSISEPIIAPKVEVTSSLTESKESEPTPKYDLEYFASAVLSTPELVRNVAFIGGLHHGKTSLLDNLFDAAYEMGWENLHEHERPVRYTDTRKDERKLKISLKTTPATLLLPARTGKSFGVTILDTPGHPNFFDEAVAAMQLADGVVVVLDAAEGMTHGVEMLVEKAVSMRLDITLVVSKIDRFILELRIPPQDAFHKIRHVIDGFNSTLRNFGGKPVSPARGDVAFAASNEGILFTLEQFAHEYIEAHGGARRFPMSARNLAKCFWGDVYYDEEDRQFSKSPSSAFAKRTFVEFVLEPLYKLHSAVVGLEIDDLKQYLSRNHLLDEGGKKPRHVYRGRVRKGSLKQDARELLRSVNSRAYGLGSVSGFVDMLVRFIGSPAEATNRKADAMDVTRVEIEEQDEAQKDTGNEEDATEEESYRLWFKAMVQCSRKRDDPMTAYVGKLIPDPKDEHFDALSRIMSGEIRVGDSVRVLGDEYHVDLNDEDQSTATVTEIFLPVARFMVPVTRAGAGQVVMLRGVSESVTKSATIVCERSHHSSQAQILKPLKELLPPPVLKIAMEPYKPSELPKMVAGIRKCMQVFPSLQSRVEQSGEHIIIAPGELYMDCVMRDLRGSYGKLEIRVSDPVVPFMETIIEASKLHCYADTPNKLNRITMTAEPLDEEFLALLESGRFEPNGDPEFEKKLPKLLLEAGWDALAAKSVWAFGPHPGKGPNVLLNDILDPKERVEAEKLKDSIVQGFIWATREGPLTDEPVRGVNLSIKDMKVAQTLIARSPAQVIPAARRVVYSAILTACPRMAEPVYLVEVQCPPKAMDICKTLMSRRRGNIISTTPVAATPLSNIRLEMPVLDSFGFETDLRNLTHGAAFCTLTFSHWALVPGDPLDKSVALRPLEPAGRRELARECMVKTRRRKGMPDDVTIMKYFDDPLLVELAQDDEELKQLM